MKTPLLFLIACVHAFLCSVASAQLPTVTIVATDADAAETLAGQPANPGNMRITRTGSTASALTVWVKVSGVAVQGEDYTFGIGTIGTFVIIPAGSSTLDIAVNVIDDFLTEGSEDVRIKLDTKTGTGGALPYVVGAADRATVNIADNEDPLAPPRAIVALSTVNASTMENSGAANPIVFRISRSNNLAPALSVRYSLGGTAVAGTDFTAPPATITIPANVASVDVPLVPIDNSVVNPDRTITFTVLPTDIVATPSPAEAYVLGTAITGTATIINDDLPPAPVVAITSPGANAAAAAGVPLTVNFTASVADGTIVSWSLKEYANVVASGSTSLPASTPPGTPYAGTASVTLQGSNTFHQLTVQVTASNGRTTTSAPISVYTFTAPPPPPPPPVLPVINIFPLDAVGAEVASGPPDTASFRVTHNFPATATVSFLFQMGGTAREGADYTLSSAGTMTSSFLGRWFTFSAGTTEAVITVTPIDDLLIEPTETVTMSLYTPPFIGFTEGGPNSFPPGTFGFYYGTNSSATVVILDNDTVPPPFPVITITATDPSGTETTDGSDPIVFTVTRTSGPTNVPLTVHYTLPRALVYSYTPPPVATNGVDFPLLSGAVTIPAGATSADIVIVPTYDLISEGDEMVHILLQPSATAWPDPAAYVLDEHISASAVIHDAAIAAGTPVVWIRVTDALAFKENFPGRTGSFSVERNVGLTDAITVSYTVGGTAVNGVDYVALPGTVTIPAGSPRASILIDPYPGTVLGSPLSVGITLQPPSLAISPPPYVLGGSSIMQRSAGISILDRYPISAQARAFYYRRQYHAIIPLPIAPAAASAPAAVAATPQTWTVEASADLINWEEIGTTDPSGENGDFVDLNGGNFTSRFYRFRPLP